MSKLNNLFIVLISLVFMGTSFAMEELSPKELRAKHREKQLKFKKTSHEKKKSKVDSEWHGSKTGQMPIHAITVDQALYKHLTRQADK